MSRDVLCKLSVLSVLHLPEHTFLASLSTIKRERQFFSNRPWDRSQMLHACADIGDISSHLKKLTHPTPGGFRGLPIQCHTLRPWFVRTFARFAPLSVRCRHHSVKSRRRKPYKQLGLLQHVRCRHRSVNCEPRPGAKTINDFRACLGAQLTICAQK